MPSFSSVFATEEGHTATLQQKQFSIGLLYPKHVQYGACSTLKTAQEGEKEADTRYFFIFIQEVLQYTTNLMCMVCLKRVYMSFTKMNDREATLEEL